MELEEGAEMGDVDGGFAAGSEVNDEVTVNQSSGGEDAVLVVLEGLLPGDGIEGVGQSAVFDSAVSRSRNGRRFCHSEVGNICISKKFKPLQIGKSGWGVFLGDAGMGQVAGCWEWWK